MHRRATFLFCGALALACSREPGGDLEGFDASIPEPVLPTPTMATATARGTAWIDELPEAEPVATKGDRVWAAVSALPEAEMAEVGVFQVEAVHDGRYSLIDRLGQRFDGVHAAVVHRVGEAKGLREGDVVLIYTKTTPGVIGRIADLVPGAEIRVRYDFGGTTREAVVDHAEPVRAGTGPLSFVSFPKSGGRSRGLVLAESADRVWVRTASGHVEIHPAKTIEALPIAREPLRPGARVRAFRWATGYRPATVVEATEPGLRYRLRLDGQSTPSDYFFATLVPAG